MTEQTPLVAAWGRDKRAIDVANNFPLKWCKRTMQLVLAAMHAHEFIHRGKLGMMLEPVRRAQRMRSHYRAAVNSPRYSYE